MSKNDDLMIITDSLIAKLNEEIEALQKEALRLSAERNFDKCGEVLKRQQAAIGALISLTEAAKSLTEADKSFK